MMHTYVVTSERKMFWHLALEIRKNVCENYIGTCPFKSFDTFPDIDWYMYVSEINDTIMMRKRWHWTSTFVLLLMRIFTKQHLLWVNHGILYRQMKCSVIKCTFIHHHGCKRLSVFRHNQFFQTTIEWLSLHVNINSSVSFWFKCIVVDNPEHYHKLV